MAGIKVKAKHKGDSVEVKALMKHPMETGQRKDKNGAKIPAHHITEVTISAAGKTLMTVDFGPAVSQNPYLSVEIAGPKKGDTLVVSWVDNMGKNESAEAVIK